MNQQLNYLSFKDKLGEWAPKFKKFIESTEMWDIYAVLKKDAIKHTIIPNSSETFQYFKKISPKKLKVIFYLSNSYSIDILYDAISDSEGEKVIYCPSLEYLFKQGVMFLNMDLTHISGKINSHKGLWEPFQQHFLEKAIEYNDIIYVLCGKEALRMKPYINPFSTIFELPELTVNWDYQDVFKKINKILYTEQGRIVHWSKEKWEIPF